MIELQADGVVVVRAFLAVTTGILVLFVGKAVNQAVRALREWNIPEPVAGGMLFALAFWMLYLSTGYQVTFELQARDVLLVYFFTTIGLNARVEDLKAGGRPLVVLLVSVAIFLILQNGAGIAGATMIGQPPALGLLAGSVAFLGGHGTAIAWAPTFEAQTHIANALEIGVLCATAGLVFGSIIAGPVARFLVQRHHLVSVADGVPEVGLHYEEAPPPPIDYFSFLHAVLAIHLSGLLGMVAYQWLAGAGINVPLFLPCLLAGLVLTNVLSRLAPGVPWPDRTPALGLIAEISLGVFLAMSLMSMQLWTLGHLSAALFVLVAVQVLLIVSFAILVVFRVLGRTYDAAVMCAGFIGFGLGATPTAMANMTAVTQRHGASHVAFLVVPLVGAFFLDLLNAVAIRVFLSWL